MAIAPTAHNDRRLTPKSVTAAPPKARHTWFSHLQQAFFIGGTERTGCPMLSLLLAVPTVVVPPGVSRAEETRVPAVDRDVWVWAQSFHLRGLPVTATAIAQHTGHSPEAISEALARLGWAVA